VGSQSSTLAQPSTSQTIGRTRSLARLTVVRVWGVPADVRATLATQLLLILIGALVGAVVAIIPRDWFAAAAGPVILVLLLLLVGLMVRQHKAARSERAWTEGSPFPGLKAFTAGQSAVFFGREDETQELVDRLNPVAGSRRHRFVAVIGSSGAGKSSLVQAGLLPALGDHWLPLSPVVPGTDPDNSLTGVLAAAGLEGPASEPADGDALAHSLGELRSGRRDPYASIVMVLDQAEELQNEVPAHKRRSFLEMLRGALRRDQRFWVVATLRSEFLTAFLDEGFEDLFHRPIVIGSLPREKLFDVIEKPAAAAGIQFEQGVVNQLVDEVGREDALPLLAYTLDVLYERLDGRTVITRNDYDQVRGVMGALPRQAERVCADLRADDPDAPVLPTLLKFVTFSGPGSRVPTRRRVEKAELRGAELRVAEGFVNARLLTRHGADGKNVFQVAHEALFREWAPLKDEIAVKATGLQLRGELEDMADRWKDSGRQDSDLLRDERLRKALRWAEEYPDLASDSPLVHEFLQRSTRSDDAALERRANAVAKRAFESIGDDPERALLLALAAVDEGRPTSTARAALTAALSATRLRGVLRGHTETLRAVAWSPDRGRLATGSEDRTVRVWGPDMRADPLVKEAEGEVRALAWAPDAGAIAVGLDNGEAWILALGGGDRMLGRHGAAINAIDWARNGRIATGSHDGTAMIWGPHGGQPERVLPHGAWVRGLAWCPHGRRLATACRDRRARIWDVEAEDGEPRVLECHREWVEKVAWSPDGHRLATVSRDGDGFVWDIHGSSEPKLLSGHTSWVQGVDWSPDGTLIATTSRDRTARIWDHCGTQLAVLRGHRHWVHGVSWSLDGHQIATASYDRTARIWDARDVTALVDVRAHTDIVQAVDWSEDGERIATASHDGTAKIWDARTGDEVAVLPHGPGVYGVAWAPDGRHVVTGAGDNAARIWAVEEEAVRGVLRGHDNWVEYVDWSPDGTRIATGSNDRTARIWDAPTRAPLDHLFPHRHWVRGVAWCPHGRRLATASYDRDARIWDVETGEVTELKGHGEWVNAVAWSPDGKRVATASVDLTARIWDAENGVQLAVLTGHEDSVQGIAWSRDGSRIATASSDGTARTWDAAGFAELAVPCVRDVSIEDVAWSRNDERLATVSDDGALQVWEAPELDLEVLLERARERRFRDLTPEERRSAMLPDEPPPGPEPDDNLPEEPPPAPEPDDDR
jgi:WD40 repeat protein